MCCKTLLKIRHLINPDVESLDVHLSLLAPVLTRLQLYPENKYNGFIVGWNL
jgi:hypothetical protein